MASQRGQLLKRNYLFAFLILFTGFGGLLGYDLYFKPYVLSQTVVKIRAADGGFIPKNYQLQQGDLYLDSVQTKDIPSGVITELSQVENKITNVNLMDGSILTDSLVDVSDLEPQVDEGIFPIPKEAIYAINGSLRSRDKVDIYLVASDKANNTGSRSTSTITGNISTGGTDGRSSLQQAGGLGSGGGVEEAGLTPPVPKVFLNGVTVNYVRSEDNNDVLDSENGNTNNRVTSTGKVATPELKLKKSEGELLGQYLEQGLKLWIVRVE
ncbi:SAF domain-containing protein [Paenibacillus camerounensis]|uniref:SAF domain-containing protein n=1 Tax=Paenibacillus camerounensis TaxID=1243663 RepID=UPI0005AA6288|nr:SAF domain-containing protein [Paenibacillus camerounensis]